MSTGGLTLFLSYAHEDEPFRRDLEKHLAALRREGLVSAWHDRLITAGAEWEAEILHRLDQSHIILLLVSPDFIASTYITEVEVRRAMQRHEMGTATVIPVLLRPSDWQGTPFAKLQAVPTNAVPISEWAGRDSAFLDVVRHLRKSCREVASTPGNPANPYVVAAVGDWYQGEIQVEVHPTGETTLASMRLTLVDKDDERAVVHARIESADLGDDERTLEIPLDRPLEDSMGQLVGAVAGQIPANAALESRRRGGGVEKLFIGGHPYYTTWISTESEMRVGRDRLLQRATRWMSSEIPLDGIVKTVTEIPGLVTQTMIVTDYGREGQHEATGTGSVHDFNTKGICRRCGCSRQGATALGLPCDTATTKRPRVGKRAGPHASRRQEPGKHTFNLKGVCTRCGVSRQGAEKLGLPCD